MMTQLINTTINSTAVARGRLVNTVCLSGDSCESRAFCAVGVVSSNSPVSLTSHPPATPGEVVREGQHAISGTNSGGKYHANKRRQPYVGDRFYDETGPDRSMILRCGNLIVRPGKRILVDDIRWKLGRKLPLTAVVRNLDSGLRRTPSESCKTTAHPVEEEEGSSGPRPEAREESTAVISQPQATVIYRKPESRTIGTQTVSSELGTAPVSVVDLETPPNSEEARLPNYTAETNAEVNQGDIHQGEAESEAPVEVVEAVDDTDTQTVDVRKMKVSIPFTMTKCVCCNNAFMNAKALREHAAASACGVEVEFVCSRCDKFTSLNNHAVSCHLPKCKGVTVDPEQSEHACSVNGCDFTFNTQVGLSQHERHNHPKLRNQKRIANVAKERAEKEVARRNQGIGSNKVWTPQEIEALIALNDYHRGSRCINKDIALDMDRKTSEQVKEKRRTMGLSKVVKGNNRLPCEIPEVPAETETISIKAKISEAKAYLNGTEDRLGIRGTLITTMDKCIEEGFTVETLSQIDDITKLIAEKWSSDSNPKSGKKKRKPRNQSKKCTKKHKRADEYRSVQILYYKNLKKLAGIILDDAPSGGCPIPTREVEETYMGRFGAVSPEVNLDDLPKPETLMDSNVILETITPAEVCKAIYGMKIDSASGPDKVEVKTIRKADPAGTIMSGLLNLWMISGTIPGQLKENRSILLPKGDPSSVDIGKWRPLTIGSVLLRIYTKIIASRMSSTVPINPRQRGFIAAAGCTENLHTIKEIIRRGKKEGKLAVAFLDLAKAFDTVSHKLVMKGLERLGATKEVIGLVADLYSEVKTKFTVTDGTTCSIPMTRGVKQGDPLSPMLFNICMDPLFCLLESRGEPLKVGDVQLASVAYADDTALLSESRKGLQKNLILVQEYCERTGLRLNVEKCAAFTIKHTNKTFLINDENPLMFDGNPLPWLEPDDTYKYLGGKVSNWHSKTYLRCEELVETLQAWCKKLTQAPLKPRQRMHILETICIPRLVDRCVTEGVAAKGTLQAIDKVSRLWTKRWLHLADDTAGPFIHLKKSEGGLGVGRLERIVPCQLAQRLQACLKSKDSVISSIARTGGFEERSAELLLKAGLATPYTKTSLLRKEKEELTSLRTQGKGAKCFFDNNVGNAWLKGPSILDEHEFLAALKLRSNTVPTREYGARGRPGTIVDCRRCGRSVETLGHISGRCLALKGLRIKRHDEVCRQVKVLALKRGFEVVETPKVIGTDGKSYFPDLILKNGEKVFIVDPTVVWDDDPKSLKEAAKGKETKYRRIVTAVETMTGGKVADVIPVVVGARGAWYGGNTKITEALTAPKGWARHVCEITLCRTVGMVREFMDM